MVYGAGNVSSQQDEQFKKMSDQIIMRHILSHVQHPTPPPPPPTHTHRVSCLDCCVLDDMGKRVDDLEKNIRELMEQVDTKEEATGTEPPSRK